MIRTRASLIKAVSEYQSQYAGERMFIPDFLSLLSHPRSFFRDHLPGHMTGSAWIVDATNKFTLLTHHAKLNRWLQPGGHADGNENIAEVAMREAVEETGLRSLRMLSGHIFDLDIHTIPARNDFPEHLHFDIRIAMAADKNETFTVTAESHDLSWIPLGEVAVRSNNNASMIRMAEKSLLL